MPADAVGDNEQTLRLRGGSLLPGVVEVAYVSVAEPRDHREERGAQTFYVRGFSRARTTQTNGRNETTGDL